jgi:signal transduction histidine kinase
MALDMKKIWRAVPVLAAPVILWGLVTLAVLEPLRFWLQGSERYDEQAIREWIEEARVFRETLPELAEKYLERTDKILKNAAKDTDKQEPGRDEAAFAAIQKREEITEALKALANPPTKMFPGQLLLFPTIYRIEIRFDFVQSVPTRLQNRLDHLDDIDDDPEHSYLVNVRELLQPIAWDSDLPRASSETGQSHQYRVLTDKGFSPRIEVELHYQLHTFGRQQHEEQQRQARGRLLAILIVAATGLTLAWFYLVQQRERARDRQRMESQHQVDAAERLRLQEEVRRQEAERLHEEAEHKLLEQKYATQTAEQQALELKSQLYAGIGIMAGSYAHNIKNLLVRPNDLLDRCLEGENAGPSQSKMLREVRETLGTVTERLQQILRTVRRDPTRSELVRIDLNTIVTDIFQTWHQLAREKWKLTLTHQKSVQLLWVKGDVSHLQQAVENLLFNARDATFEMRNHLRDEARKSAPSGTQEQREAIIAAASWRGEVNMRCFAEGDHAVLEINDNGIGMESDVVARCRETHFSTKRDNALYQGMHTGMGLGLAFVDVILNHHQANLHIESTRLKGTTMRAVFPLDHG